MADDNQSRGTIELILSGIVVLAALIYLFAGGGVKEVTSDKDLPPVASPEKK